MSARRGRWAIAAVTDGGNARAPASSSRAATSGAGPVISTGSRRSSRASEARRMGETISNAVRSAARSVFGWRHSSSRRTKLRTSSSSVSWSITTNRAASNSASAARTPSSPRSWWEFAQRRTATSSIPA
ncbi:hypothetical protein [Actinokineospora inagensis]|uniref:hypothetical protein n=1 Tax=Actinokineospora inagensis TaxID=103730 RepID=UPI0012FA9A36|nr:hypothetical protein [Actinokineospora inagensis]